MFLSTWGSRTKMKTEQIYTVIASVSMVNKIAQLPICIFWIPP